jgi:hypothetical protein
VFESDDSAAELVLDLVDGSVRLGGAVLERITRSQSRSTSSIWWVTMTTVAPLAFWLPPTTTS